MNLFQWITVPLFVLLAVLSVTAAARGRVFRPVGMLWTVLSLAAALTIAFPESTRFVARMLGIGRGADLVFYCAIVGGAIGFFAIFVRLRSLDRQITELVRHLAIKSAIPAADGTAGNLPPDDGPAR